MICTVALSKFVSSTSANVRVESMTVAPSPSVNANVAPASAPVGASFDAVILTVVVPADE